MIYTPRAGFRHLALALSGAAMLAIPAAAGAASLGHINILSALGEPLRAEMDILGTPEEWDGMVLQLAPGEAFEQSGIDFDPALADLHFSIETRADGSRFARVSSRHPVFAPFLDLLVELRWRAGRLLREYGVALEARPAARRDLLPVVPPAIAPLPMAGLGEAGTLSAPVPDAHGVLDEALPAGLLRGEPKDMHTVEAGETLRGIAARYRAHGVSLEQMLLALYRANPQAFPAADLNRLQAGSVLAVPDDGVAASVPDEEAKAQLVALSGDASRYRRALGAFAAQAPAHPESDGRSASGRVSAQVEDTVPAPGDKARDQVRVSRSQRAPARGAEEDRVANERAAEDTRERIAALEANLAAQRQLLEMRDQPLALRSTQPAPSGDEEGGLRRALATVGLAGEGRWLAGVPDVFVAAAALLSVLAAWGAAWRRKHLARPPETASAPTVPS